MNEKWNTGYSAKAVKERSFKVWKYFKRKTVISGRLKLPNTMSYNFVKHKVVFWYFVRVFIKLDEDEVCEMQDIYIVY